MDCEAAEPLIEALCDDELDVATAASLLAHLEGCAGCASLRRGAETRKAAVQEARPVDRLPDEVRARLIREVVRTAPSRRRAFLAISTGLAALGLLVGVVAAGFVLRRVPPRPPTLADLSVVKEVAGEVFCLRCALASLFPDTPVQDQRHLPVLRTDEGEVLTLLDGPVTEAALAKKGCAGRRVVLTVRLYPAQELAEVLSVRAVGPSSVPPPRDAVTAAAARVSAAPR